MIENLLIINGLSFNKFSKNIHYCKTPSFQKIITNGYLFISHHDVLENPYNLHQWHHFVSSLIIIAVMPIMICKNSNNNRQKKSNKKVRIKTPNKMIIKAI